MLNVSVIDISVFLLITALTLILAIYNRRQALAIEEIGQRAEDLLAMQIRDRRAKREITVIELDPQAWLETQAQAVADKPVEVVSVRALASIKAAELTLKDDSKVLISPLSEAELKRYERQQKRSRLTNFAAMPVLSGRYQLAARTLLDNEFLDIEAASVAQRLGLDWLNPARLWVYIF